MSLYCIVLYFWVGEGDGGVSDGLGFFYLSFISFLSVLFFWNKVNNYAWKQVNKTKIVKVKLCYTTILYALNFYVH